MIRNTSGGSSTAPAIASAVSALTPPENELVVVNSTETGNLSVALPLSVGLAGGLQTVGSVSQAMNLTRQGKMTWDEPEVLIQRQATEQRKDSETSSKDSTRETGIASRSASTDRLTSDDVFADWGEETLQELMNRQSQSLDGESATESSV